MPRDSRASIADEGDRDRFRALLRDRAGLEMSHNRDAELDRALSAIATASGIDNLKVLYARLGSPAGAGTFDDLVGALAVGETHFFRHRPQLAALERYVLPDIIARRRAARQLRVWSAGCASGEEAYTLAILLERVLPDMDTWDVRVLATDLVPRLLAKAEHGLYGSWSFRGVPAEVETGWFMRHGDDREVHPRLRRRVTFAQLDLIGDSYPSPVTRTSGLDLVLCRNVLMYFDPATARRVVARLHGALADGGWLVVAPAELPRVAHHGFLRSHFPGAVFLQKRADESVRRDRPPRNDLRPADVHPPSVPSTKTQAEVDIAESAGSLPPDDPSSAELLYLLGLMQEEQGEVQTALTTFRRSVCVDPSFALGRYALGAAFLRRGQRRRALKEFANVSRLLAGRPSTDPVAVAAAISVTELQGLVDAQVRLLEG